MLASTRTGVNAWPTKELSWHAKNLWAHGVIFLLPPPPIPPIPPQAISEEYVKTIDMMRELGRRLIAADCTRLPMVPTLCTGDPKDPVTNDFLMLLGQCSTHWVQIVRVRDLCLRWMVCLVSWEEESSRMACVFANCNILKILAVMQRGVVSSNPALGSLNMPCASIFCSRRFSAVGQRSAFSSISQESYFRTVA